MPQPVYQIVTPSVAATWAEARKLTERVRSGARAWLELGVVLEELRAQFFAQGSRTDITSPHRAAKSGSPTPHRAASENGWQAKVREELGISDDTARRWMLDGRRYGQLLQIAQGELSTVEDRRVTAEIRGNAIKAIEEIQIDPSVRPARLWAGVWGASATKGRDRAPVNHARNIARGLTALQTSLPHWAKLKPEERAALERGWEIIRDLLPPTFR